MKKLLTLLFLVPLVSLSQTVYISSNTGPNIDSAVVRANRKMDSTRVNTLLAGKLANADSTTLKNSILSQVLKNADSTSIRNRSNVLYLAKTAFTDSARAHSLGVNVSAGQGVVAASTDSIYSVARFPVQILADTAGAGNGTGKKLTVIGGVIVVRNDSVGTGAAGLVAADSVLIRNYSNALYLKNADSTSIRNYSSSLYLKNADSTTLKSSILSQVLKNADSTSIRNYSSSLYLKNADSTTLKNSVLKNADSTSIRNRSNALYLKNADSTTVRTYSNALYLKNADSTTLKNSLLKNADSTTIRTYSNALYVAKASATPIFSAGLIDSVKTTDTVFVGFIAPAATIDSIVFSGARSQSLTARLEMVDSLYQTAGVTLLDTTTCVTILRKRTSAVAGGSFTLTLGKIVRMVFPVVGVMPKSFNVTIVGHR